MPQKPKATEKVNYIDDAITKIEENELNTVVEKYMLPMLKTAAYSNTEDLIDILKALSEVQLLVAKQISWQHDQDLAYYTDHVGHLKRIIDEI